MKIPKVSREVWRVGYRPEPWEWADWRWAGPEGRFTGRWDALEGGLYRIIYAGGSLEACLIELLAPFRKDPLLAMEMGEIDVDAKDVEEHPTVPSGFIDVDEWLGMRLASSAHLNGSFCDVTDSQTIATLREQFYPKATLEYGLHDFDTAALKDARPRELTQSVSQYLWNTKTTSGDDLCDGIEFRSRHGDDLVLWAVFEREGDGQISPHLSGINHQCLGRNHPELISAFRLLGLQMLPGRY